MDVLSKRGALERDNDKRKAEGLIRSKPQGAHGLRARQRRR